MAGLGFSWVIVGFDVFDCCVVCGLLVILVVDCIMCCCCWLYCIVCDYCLAFEWWFVWTFAVGCFDVGGLGG